MKKHLSLTRSETYHSDEYLRMMTMLTGASSMPKPTHLSSLVPMARTSANKVPKSMPCGGAWDKRAGYPKVKEEDVRMQVCAPAARNG
jgi:hypothetical protein